MLQINSWPTFCTTSPALYAVPARYCAEVQLPPPELPDPPEELDELEELEDELDEELELEEEELEPPDDELPSQAPSYFQKSQVPELVAGLLFWVQ